MVRNLLQSVRSDVERVELMQLAWAFPQERDRLVVAEPISVFDCITVSKKMRVSPTLLERVN